MPYFPPQQTALDILIKLKTVDGSGSGLDADTIDGLHANELSTVAALNDLTDVVISSVSSGQVLKYNGTNWVNDSDLVGSGDGETDHGALTGLSDDDHSQYLLATGSRTGATASRQVFTSGITTGSIRPSSDSTTALQLQNAAGTTVVTVDTTNGTSIMQSGSAASVALVARGAVAQTADIHQWQNSAAIVLSRITKNGNLQIGSLSDNVGMGVGKTIVSTDLLGGGYFGVLSALTCSLSSNANTIQGVRAIVASGGSMTNGYIYGADYGVEHAGSGSGNNIYAFRTTIGVSNSASSSAASTAGATVQVYSANSSYNMGTFYGFRLFVQYVGSKATTAYGLYMDSVSSIGNTAYSIYTNAGDVRLMSSNSDKIGFHGVTPVARQLLATGAGATVDNVITALQNLGLLRQS